MVSIQQHKRFGRVGCGTGDKQLLRQFDAGLANLTSQENFSLGVLTGNLSTVTVTNVNIQS